MLPTINLFGHAVNMYWLCYIAAICVGSGVAYTKRKSFKISSEHLLRILALCVIGGMVGARGMYACYQIVRFSSNPGFWTFENWRGILNNGGVLYGGLIAGTALVVLYATLAKIPRKHVADLMAYATPAFGAVARFGCLFAGCCYGIQVRHMLSVPGTVYATPRVPSPLLESALNLAILLLFLLGRWERTRPGILFPAYLLLYSAGRFVLEFFRGDANRGAFWIFSTSQWIALLVIVAVIGFLCWKQRKKKGFIAIK
ncbi:MAG: prolipoprotein diacylglyceryl transferase [Oscillospiraceae bacterium]|jgi:phosphatidylglycerol:prolipoprotein diacylglycerol transferase|nr:prolipoprotein diacylglyceryl transferase [Oscillospiraceae bacterium]